MKAIPGYDGYFADEDGCILSNRCGKLKKLKPYLQSKGYYICSLHVNGKQITKRVHQLVALAYYGATPEGFEICHNNGVKVDNRPTNLRFDTRVENRRDILRHNGYRLNTEDYQDIKWLNNQGVPLKEVAQMYGISHIYAKKINSR